MLKKQTTPVQLAQKLLRQRVSKAETRKLLAAKAGRARFIADVVTAHASDAKHQEAVRLVQQVRDAKSAQFLKQYRTEKR